MGTARALAFVLLFLSLPHAFAEEPKKSGSLDGKSFVTQMGEKGKGSGIPDTLLFKEGKFYSTGCEAWGFGWATYTVTSESGASTFESTTTSPVEGMMKWKATIKGDQIEGGVIWTKSGQRDIEYWLKGSIKKK